MPQPDTEIDQGPTQFDAALTADGTVPAPARDPPLLGDLRRVQLQDLPPGRRFVVLRQRTTSAAVPRKLTAVNGDTPAQRGPSSVAIVPASSALPSVVRKCHENLPASSAMTSTPLSSLVV